MAIEILMNPREYVQFRLSKYGGSSFEIPLNITDNVIGAYILKIMISIDNSGIEGSNRKNDFYREGNFFAIPEWYWDQNRISQKQLREWRQAFRSKGILTETRKGHSSRLKMRINYDILASMLADDRGDEIND